MTSVEDGSATGIGGEKGGMEMESDREGVGRR